MRRELQIRNRQRIRHMDIPLLRRILRHLVESEMAIASYALGVHFIDHRQMAQLNQNYLDHAGSTDVITFDHSEGGAGQMYGELFISVADAVAQAREFRTTWPAEIVRYLIHGLLHLRGFDDLASAPRRLMKREENRLLRKLEKQFNLRQVAKPSV